VIAAAAGGWFLYTKIQDQLNDSKPVAVPDVTRLQKDLAKAKIEEVGLSAQFQYEPDETVPSGQVSSQNPGPGTKISKTSTVTLVVSTGIPEVTVPGVVGQDVTSAVAALAQAGLEQHIKRIYSGQQQDTVTGQNPAAGDHVKKGSTVTINVSRGPKPVTLPDVTGQPYLQAESVLRGQGFTVARVDVQSDQQPQGVVVSMDPPQGTDVAKGSKVTLSVSKGPATSAVPDVTNQTQSTATRILKGAGFTVGLVMQPVNDPSQDGIVVSQDPVGGSTGQQGEVVVITVGQLQAGGGGGGGGNNQGAPPTTTAVTTTQTTTSVP